MLNTDPDQIHNLCVCYKLIKGVSFGMTGISQKRLDQGYYHNQTRGKQWGRGKRIILKGAVFSEEVQRG